MVFISINWKITLKAISRNSAGKKLTVYLSCLSFGHFNFLFAAFTDVNFSLSSSRIMGTSYVSSLLSHQYLHHNNNT